MNAYKITEKPNASLGRVGYIITSGGGITEAAFYGDRLKAVAEQACAIMNGQAEQPLPMDTAPRNGTMVRLLVQFDDHATEDTDGAAWTIGANSYEENGEDLWQFAGWCWTHDHFTEGKGTPIGWLPMVSGQAVQS